jgi:integrase
MPYAELPALMATLGNGDPSSGRLGLRFLILTAARSGEVRGATWFEIDFEKALWCIPAARMKVGDPHCVPLSAEALEILRLARDLNGDKPDRPIFADMKGKAMSDMTLGKALSVAGAGAYTVHGMRSAFRDWVAEQTSFPGDWAEAALAHTLPNKVEAAYRRTKFVEQRRRLMDAWGDYLGGASNVAQLGSG